MFVTNRSLKIIGAAGLLLAAAGEVQEAGSELSAAPVYEARGRRDPFVQPEAGRLRGVMDRVDISALKLTGVIRRAERAMALFAGASQGGARFGYLLKNGQLFRENNQPVQGVSGEVLNPNETVLRQGDRQIIFKLR